MTWHGLAWPGSFIFQMEMSVTLQNGPTEKGKNQRPFSTNILISLLQSSMNIWKLDTWLGSKSMHKVASTTNTTTTTTTTTTITTMYVWQTIHYWIFGDYLQYSNSYLFRYSLRTPTISTLARRFMRRPNSRGPLSESYHKTGSW
jgi:hypothetical protein